MGLRHTGRITARIMAATVALTAVTAATPAAAATQFANCDDGDSLQAAIDAADVGGAVIAQGTCIGVFRIAKDLSLFGFFSVTLQSNSGSSTVSIAGDVTVTVENAVVTSSGSSGRGVEAYGGADVTLRHVEIRDHDSAPVGTSALGGGLALGGDSTMLIEDGWIHGNDSYAVGGGIRNGGAMTIRNTTIEGNRSGVGLGGGAIFNGEGATLSVSNSLIDGNSDNFREGAVHNRGTATIVDTTISGNTAGLRNVGSLTLLRSTVVDNIAGYQGKEGGGLQNDAGAVAWVTSSTIAGNGATVGGGIHNAGTLHLTASTVSDNIAYSQNVGSWPPDAGGLWNDGVVELESSIVSGNDVYSWGDCGGSTPLHSHGGNVLNADCQLDGPPTGVVFASDPKLAPVGQNGGNTATMALLAGSPASDAGHCMAATDQRGVTRPQGAACDAGAYENRAPQTPAAPALSGGTQSPNTGNFQLAWAAATDPDGDPVRYLLQSRDADDSAWQDLGTPTTTSSRLIASSPEGTLRYRVLATDGNVFGTASVASAAVVVDRTGPAAPSLTTDRTPEFTDAGSLDWYADSVVVQITPGADPLLADGSLGTGTVTSASSETVTQHGATTVSATSIDAIGNVSPEASLTVHVDTVDPTVAFDACPETVVLHEAVSLTWHAADDGAGLAGDATGAVVVDTSAIGPVVTTVDVTDNVGHVSASADCTSQVVFDFSGFASPLAVADGGLAALKAGQDFRVAFSLSGYQGLGVVAGNPSWTPIDCDTRAPLGDAEAVRLVRPTEYVERFDQYRLVVQAEKARRRTCARFELTLVDGQTHGVDVKFR